MTTFSGVMFYSCVALFGPSAHSTYAASNYFSILVSLFSSSFAGFVIGRHFSQIIVQSSFNLKKNLLCMKDHGNRWIFPTLISISVPCSIILAVLLPISRWTYLTYSILFAPFGSLTRYLLSILFNPNRKFPLGTFLANLFGSLIYFGIVSVIIYSSISSVLVKQILIGVLQGYCGCLTTVSTFILELNTIESRKILYLYAVISIVLIQLIYIPLGFSFSSLCS